MTDKRKFRYGQPVTPLDAVSGPKPRLCSQGVVDKENYIIDQMNLIKKARAVRQEAKRDGNVAKVNRCNEIISNCNGSKDSTAAWIRHENSWWSWEDFAARKIKSNIR